MKGMKGKSWKWVDLGVVLLVAGLAIAQTRTKAQLHPQTMKNLHTAMKGEAFAYAKYTLYAEQARRNGHPEIAQLFENAAKTERFEHFAEEAEIADLVGSDERNLEDAIRGETYESTTMYKEFSEQAAAAGDKQAAERFEEIRRDEMKHRVMFEAALKKLSPSSEARK
jgi:rubrerythrin